MKLLLIREIIVIQNSSQALKKIKLFFNILIINQSALKKNIFYKILGKIRLFSKVNSIKRKIWIQVKFKKNKMKLHQINKVLLKAKKLNKTNMKLLLKLIKMGNLIYLWL